MTGVTTKRTLRGSVAVVGIGETTYFKRGASPDAEFVLALKAVLAACADAGIDPRDIDGFASYAGDRNEPTRLAAALGIKELRFSNMQWGGGGGGGSGAVGNAAAAVAAGMADCVVVFRALAQGQFGRFGAGSSAATVSGGGAARAHPTVLCPQRSNSPCGRSGSSTSTASHPRRNARWRWPRITMRSKTLVP